MMPDGPLDPIRRRDEILQVLFWLRGEGLADEVGPDQLRVFLGSDAGAVIATDLEDLARAGLLEPLPGGRFRLTEAGRSEGGRRFADEFADYVHQGHGACSDPNCDCHTLGPDACVHTAGSSLPGGDGA